MVAVFDNYDLLTPKTSRYVKTCAGYWTFAEKPMEEQRLGRVNSEKVQWKRLVLGSLLLLVLPMFFFKNIFFRLCFNDETREMEAYWMFAGCWGTFLGQSNDCNGWDSCILGILVSKSIAPKQHLQVASPNHQIQLAVRILKNLEQPCL